MIKVRIFDWVGSAQQQRISSYHARVKRLVPSPARSRTHTPTSGEAGARPSLSHVTGKPDHASGTPSMLSPARPEYVLRHPVQREHDPLSHSMGKPDGATKTPSAGGRAMQRLLLSPTEGDTLCSYQRDQKGTPDILIIF